MGKRGNMIFDVVAFLLVITIIIIIVLASLGYFNKKRSDDSGDSRTRHATTCLPPDIRNVVYGRSSNNVDTFHVELSNLLENCGDFSTNGRKNIYYKLEIFQDGKQFQTVSDSSSEFTKSFFMAKAGSLLPSGNYTGDIRVGFEFDSGPLYSKIFNFSFKVD